MSDPHEVWKQTEVEGYEVSNLGRVRSWRPVRNNAPIPKQPRLLSIAIDKDGYPRVTLYINKKRVDIHVHRLVCSAFNRLPEKDEQVRHLDGSKDNNTPENLLWGSALENSLDRANHGTQIKGCLVNTNKLTEDQVLSIRSDCRKPIIIAEENKVSISLIYKIKSKEIWKHV